MGKSAIGSDQWLTYIPIFIEKISDGKMEPTLIGSVPDMQSDIAVEALNAAVKAFARGQGLWPT